MKIILQFENLGELASLFPRDGQCYLYATATVAHAELDVTAVGAWVGAQRKLMLLLWDVQFYKEAPEWKTTPPPQKLLPG